MEKSLVPIARPTSASTQNESRMVLRIRSRAVPSPARRVQDFGWRLKRRQTASTSRSTQVCLAWAHTSPSAFAVPSQAPVTPFPLRPRFGCGNASIFSCQRTSTASCWPLGAQPLLIPQSGISARGGKCCHFASTLPELHGGDGKSIKCCQKTVIFAGFNHHFWKKTIVLRFFVFWQGGVKLNS